MRAARSRAAQPAASPDAAGSPGGTTAGAQSTKAPAPGSRESLAAATFAEYAEGTGIAEALDHVCSATLKSAPGPAPFARIARAAEKRAAHVVRATAALEVSSDGGARALLTVSATASADCPGRAPLAASVPIRVADEIAATDDQGDAGDGGSAAASAAPPPPDDEAMITINDNLDRLLTCRALPRDAPGITDVVARIGAALAAQGAQTHARAVQHAAAALLCVAPTPRLPPELALLRFAHRERLRIAASAAATNDHQAQEPTMPALCWAERRHVDAACPTRVFVACPVATAELGATEVVQRVVTAYVAAARAATARVAQYSAARASRAMLAEDDAAIAEDEHSNASITAAVGSISGPPSVATVSFAPQRSSPLTSASATQRSPAASVLLAATTTPAATGTPASSMRPSARKASTAAGGASEAAVSVTANALPCSAADPALGIPVWESPDSLVGRVERAAGATGPTAGDVWLQVGALEASDVLPHTLPAIVAAAGGRRVFVDLTDTTYPSDPTSAATLMALACGAGAAAVVLPAPNTPEARALWTAYLRLAEHAHAPNPRWADMPRGIFRPVPAAALLRPAEEAAASGAE